MSTVLIDRDPAHDAAQQELNKPIYPTPSLTDKIGQWLDDQLFKLLTSAEGVPGGWLTITVLVLVLVAAIVLAVRVARRTMRTNRGGDAMLFDSGQLSAADHRGAAEKCAADGNWAAAIQHRLRAIARYLEDTGVLAEVPGRTANELATDSADAYPDLRSEFFTAATIFNDVTYGERPGTTPGYQVIVDLDTHLRERRTPTGTAAGPVSDQWAQIR